MTDLRLLKRHVQDALDTAVRNRNQFPQAAVNWADLSCRGVSECRTDGEAMPVIVVLIEEADPVGNEDLQEFLLEELERRGWGFNRCFSPALEINFEW